MRDTGWQLAWGILTFAILAGCPGEKGAVTADGPALESTAGSGSESATPPDSGDGETSTAVDDSATTDGDLVFSSDDVDAPSPCSPITVLCADGDCSVDVDLHPITISGELPEGSLWGLQFRDVRMDIGAYNPMEGSHWGLITPFGSFTAWLEGPSYSMVAFPGEYDVTLVYQSSSDPSRAFHLASGLVLTEDATLDANLPFHRVSGEITLDGLPVVGTLRFEDGTTGSYSQGEALGAFTVDLPDGTWDATFTPDQADLPTGPFPVGAVEVAGARVAMSAALEAYPVTGTLLVDGVPLEELGHGDTWLLRFYDADGDTFDLRLPGGTAEWSSWLPPGLYQASLEGVLVGQDLEVSGPAELSLANDAPVVTGSFTVNGRTAPAWWYLVFSDPVTGVETQVADAAWSTVLPPGIYDVYVDFAGATNGRVRVQQDLAVIEGSVLDFAIESVYLSGTAFWNSRPPTEGWSVAFVDEAGLVSQTFGEPDDRNWRAELPAGTYDVYLSLDHFQTDQHALVVSQRKFVEGETLELRGETHPVYVNVTLDGAPTEIDTVLVNNPTLDETYSEYVVGDPPPLSVDVASGTYTFMVSLPVVHEAGTEALLPIAWCAVVSE